MAKKARELMAKDGLNADDAARLLRVSRRTLFRGLQAMLLSAVLNKLHLN